jgi:AcrR family transcriptional regulator
MQTSPLTETDYYKFTYDKSSRSRILNTAKILFASLGYDNTSTALIARNASTSESQLMKHFGGKAGLLESMFSEGWDRINAQLATCFESAADLNSRLSCVPGVVFQSLESDLELRTLVMLEGHRMRRAALSEGTATGYERFLNAIDRVIQQAKTRGEFRGDASALSLRSAVVGIVEEGIREQVLAHRTIFPARFNSEEYTQVMGLFLRALGSGASAICARG